MNMKPVEIAAIEYGKVSRILYTSHQSLDDFNANRIDGFLCGTYNERYGRTVPLAPIKTPTVVEKAMKLTGTAGETAREQELLEMITQLQVALGAVAQSANEVVKEYHSWDNGRSLRWAVDSLKDTVARHTGVPHDHS